MPKNSWAFLPVSWAFAWFMGVFACFEGCLLRGRFCLLRLPRPPPPPAPPLHGHFPSPPPPPSPQGLKGLGSQRFRVSRVWGFKGLCLKGLGSQGFRVIGFRRGFWVRWILSFKPIGNVLCELCIFLMLCVSWVGVFCSNA